MSSKSKDGPINVTDIDVFLKHSIVGKLLPVVLTGCYMVIAKKNMLDLAPDLLPLLNRLMVALDKINFAATAVNPGEDSTLISSKPAPAKNVVCFLPFSEIPFELSRFSLC